MQQTLTNASSGVDYAGGLDAYKRKALKAGERTSHHLNRLGASPCEESRGESAYVWREDVALKAHVNEGLGTKNRVADAALWALGRSFYGSIAQDTVAMITGDLATVGAAPATIMQHLAVQSSDWFKTPHSGALVEGWEKACNAARVCWGGGETPALWDMIPADMAIISGSATGVIRKDSHYLRGDRIMPGDAIVLVGSSGIHANALSMARKLASRLPMSFGAILPDGRSYGEHLLDPTVIYAPLVEDCLTEELDLHYAVHITGHGWRKLMRATQPFRYVVEKLPTPQAIFDFIVTNGPVDPREAYGSLNMGAGFALYLPEKDAPRAIGIAKGLGMDAWNGGHIEAADKSSVVLIEKDIIFRSEELDVR